MVGKSSSETLCNGGLTKVEQLAIVMKDEGSIITPSLIILHGKRENFSRKAI